jgi:hypothetical protein
MKERMRPDPDVHVVAQVVGAGVAAQAEARLAAEAAALGRQDAALAGALRSVEQVRSFVDAREDILGNASTKHGEIAEQVEVGIRNARDLLGQRMPSATFEGVGRTAPVDYIVDGEPIQSKFINGARQTLDHVLRHMDGNPGFGTKGTGYHIPRDQYATIEAALRGEAVPGLSDRAARTLVEKARAIEAAVGRPFAEAVRPGVSDYAEVQQGRIHETLNRHSVDLKAENEHRRASIQEDHAPNLAGGAAAAGQGAAVGAGVRLAHAVYRKHKAGKRLFQGEYSMEDWQELGVEGVTGGVQGGIAAGAIYALTNCAEMAAPFAGALVSSALAVGHLVAQYRRGEIPFGELVALGQFACLEGAVVGLASAVGQAVIPIPAIGALVGAVAGRWLLSLARDLLGEEEAALRSALERDFQDVRARLDREAQRFIEGVLGRYDRLGRLADLAFDLERNVGLRLGLSVELARAYGVPEGEILHDVDDVDAFLLS